MEVGFLLRDHDGFVLGGGLNFQKDVANSNWAEALAFMQSITWLETITGIMMFEGDSATIINRFNRQNDDVSLIEHMLRQCQTLISNFNYCVVNWSHQSCNKAANCSSKIAPDRKCNYFFSWVFLVRSKTLFLLIINNI